MNKQAILFMLLSTACFSLVNLVVKYLDHLPVHELVFFRSVISLVISAVFVKVKGIAFWGNNKKWLLVRGIFGATALTLFFFTIKGLPLAVATTIQYLSPIFTVIIASYLVKEKIVRMQWVFFFIAFAGVLMLKFQDELSGGKSAEIPTIFFLMGIASAFLSGIAYNAIMKCRHTDHPMTVVMYFPLVATPVMGIWCAFSWIQPEGSDRWLILVNGIITQIAQYAMTRAFHLERASKVTPFKYLGAVYASLIGWLMFDEIIGFWAIAGMIAVILGLILNSIYKLKTSTSA